MCANTSLYHERIRIMENIENVKAVAKVCAENILEMLSTETQVQLTPKQKEYIAKKVLDSSLYAMRHGQRRP
jgi:hypothetical protein